MPTTTAPATVVEITVSDRVFTAALATKFEPSRSWKAGAGMRHRFTVEVPAALAIADALATRAADEDDKPRPSKELSALLWNAGHKASEVALAAQAGTPVKQDEVPDLTDESTVEEEPTVRPTGGTGGKLSHAACDHAKTTWGRRQCQKAAGSGRFAVNA